MFTTHLILGGGFAGWAMAQRLAKSKQQVALVSEENYATFQPMLPEVIGGELSPLHVVTPLRELCKPATIIKGAVLSVDTVNKKVVVQTSDFTKLTLTYEHLTLALGSKTDLSRTPGMTEHAFMLQNAMDATRIRNEVLTRLESGQWEENPLRKKRLLTFVVVGGGYSGVEVAGQIQDLINNSHRTYPNLLQGEAKVILIHGRDLLLPTLDKRLGKAAENILRKNGVDIRLNERVNAVTATAVFTSSEAYHNTYEANTVICTIGNSINPIIKTLAKEHNYALEGTRLIVDKFSYIPNTEIKAIGDCGVLTSYTKKGDLVCPPTAQFAYRIGRWAADNVLRKLKNVEEKTFTFTGLGELAAIGHHQAVGQVFGFKLTGFICWWLWRTVYLMKLPGLDRKINVGMNWGLHLFYPRETSVVSPKYTKFTGAQHLESGDKLFTAGDPVFSLYLIKKGRIKCTRVDGAVAYVTAGGTLGYNNLSNGVKCWDYEAVAEEATELVSMTKDTFLPFKDALKVVPPKFVEPEVMETT